MPCAIWPQVYGRGFNAPDLNPDELVWSYAKRTGVSRNPLRAGEKLVERVHEKLSEIITKPALVKSFFKHQSVSYINGS